MEVDTQDVLAPQGGQQPGQDSKPSPQVSQTEFETMQKRFAGMQGAYNKLQQTTSEALTKAEQENIALRTQIEELTLQLTNVRGESGSALSQLEQAKKQIEERDTQITSLSTYQDRVKALHETAATNPFILKDESEGLLRQDLSGQEFTDYLNKYVEANAVRQQAFFKEQIQGTVPPSSPAKDADDQVSSGEVALELMSLDPNDPKWEEQFNLLFK